MRGHTLFLLERKARTSSWGIFWTDFYITLYSALVPYHDALYCIKLKILITSQLGGWDSRLYVMQYQK